MKVHLQFKEKITVLLFTLIITSSYAQTTSIPDPNFEQALIDLGYDTPPIDGSVPTANISGITNLDISNQNISDLTGIEDFTALEVLLCYTNNLSSLDVSANTALTTLSCSQNNLTSLDVSVNTALTILYCSENNLTSLNVSANTALIELICFINNLTSLDVSANTALTNLICYSNDLTNLDVSNNNSALTYLDCSSNDLTSLDVSTNTALTDLLCYSNNLTSLDVSANIALEVLVCFSNDLTNLDVSANIALLYLVCTSNNLTGLDVSANADLVSLWCDSNNLTSLNVKNGNNINFQNFYSTTNPNLTCIQVDDAAWSTANWTNIDPQHYFSEDCNLGISELEQNVISIHPNPARSFFKIDSELPLSEVIIYSITGKMVSKFKTQESYNVSNLKQGMYFIAVKSNNKIGIQKLMID